jgi:hypothetical protein
MSYFTFDRKISLLSMSSDTQMAKIKINSSNKDLKSCQLNLEIPASIVISSFKIRSEEDRILVVNSNANSFTNLEMNGENLHASGTL